MQWGLILEKILLASHKMLYKPYILELAQEG